MQTSPLESSCVVVALIENYSTSKPSKSLSWKITHFELWYCCRKWAICYRIRRFTVCCYIIASNYSVVVGVYVVNYGSVLTLYINQKAKLMSSLSIFLMLLLTEPFHSSDMWVCVGKLFNMLIRAQYVLLWKYESLVFGMWRYYLLLVFVWCSSELVFKLLFFVIFNEVL